MLHLLMLLWLIDDSHSLWQDADGSELCGRERWTITWFVATTQAEMFELFVVLVYIFGAAMRKAHFWSWQAILTKLKTFSIFCHLRGHALIDLNTFDFDVTGFFNWINNMCHNIPVDSGADSRVDSRADSGVASGADLGIRIDQNRLRNRNCPGNR